MFFKVIDFSQFPSLLFFQEIHVLPNYCQFHEIQTTFDENPIVDLRLAFSKIALSLELTDTC